MSNINVGIIGAGRIGQIHAKNLSSHIPNTKVLAIADKYIDAAKACAFECNIPHIEEDYHSILENKDIDAIFICSSTDTHAQIIIEGAEAGKDIFCEKPIDFDLDKIDKALEAIEKSKIKFQIGFQRRFDPSFRKARDYISEGKLGTPYIVSITSRDPQPPPIEYIKVSGGLFLDMMIHDFDLSRFLIDEEIVEIYATGDSLIDPRIKEAGDIDTAIAILKYKNGAMCTINNSRKAVYGYDQRVEILGSKGCIVVGNRTPHSTILQTGKSIESSLPLYFFLERYQEAYIEEARSFIEAIQNDITPTPTGYDGKIAVEIAKKAKDFVLKK